MAVCTFPLYIDADCFEQIQSMPVKLKEATLYRERLSYLAYTPTQLVFRCPKKAAISCNELPLFSSWVAQAWRSECGPKLAD